MQKIALITAGIIFALLAMSHAIRWLAPIEILIGGNNLPLTISLLSGIFLTLLSIWMFVAAKNMKESSRENEGEQEKSE